MADLHEYLRRPGAGSGATGKQLKAPSPFNSHLITKIQTIARFHSMIKQVGKRLNGMFRRIADVIRVSYQICTILHKMQKTLLVTLLYLSSIKVYSVMEDLLSLNRQIKALI